MKVVKEDISKILARAEITESVQRRPVKKKLNIWVTVNWRVGPNLKVNRGRIDVYITVLPNVINALFKNT